MKKFKNIPKEHCPKRKAQGLSLCLSRDFFMNKKIDGFPNYEINSSGLVFNIKKNKLVKTFLLNGYYYLHLICGDINKTISLHRLIALHFIPNIENKKVVNHINGIKTDNRLENLEWVTQSDNCYLYYNDCRISNIKHLL